MNKDFLLEIGTEEIPASYLEHAVDDLEKLITDCLRDNLISFNRVNRFYTPRRLTIFIDGIATKGEDKVKIITGPPKEVAYKDGKAAPSLIGFVKAHRASPEDVKIFKKRQKEVIGIEKVEKGQSSSDVLKKKLPITIEQIDFPRSMRWESSGVRFARPIRWIACLFGRDILKFKIAGITSGRSSMGLRGREIRIDLPINYESLLESNKIIPDPKKRRDEIKRQISEKTIEHSLEWVVDEELLGEVTNMVESPVVIIGEFDESFLSLPDEVIRAALKGHQRYFWTEKDGKKSNYFISVANNPDGDFEVIRKGNERVLESRLEDAQFYWKEDLKIPLASRIEDLNKMMYNAELGTLYQKGLRMKELSLFLRNWIGDVLPDVLERAAFLSKADLTTNMIKDGKEFTKLEGIIGAEYALKQGEDLGVVNALREQYLPGFADDRLPDTKEGMILSLSDKIDSLVGGYLVSGIPTSSKDPKGMRRIANGIVRIILDKSISLPLVEVIQKAFNLYEKDYSREVFDFIIQRARQYMLDGGISHDILTAVFDKDDILEMKLIAQTLTDESDLQDIILASKRINNILKGSGELKKEVDRRLFREKEERELFSRAEKAKPLLDESISEKRFYDSINILRDIVPYVNNLFDEVLIMSTDQEIKANRFALLNYISHLFNKVSDFTRLPQ